MTDETDTITKEEWVQLLASLSGVLPKKINDPELGAIISWILSCYNVPVDRSQSLLAKVVSHQVWLQEKDSTTKGDYHVH